MGYHALDVSRKSEEPGRLSVGNQLCMWTAPRNIARLISIQIEIYEVHSAMEGENECEKIQ
jgi:hypothetical protein